MKKLFLIFPILFFTVCSFSLYAQEYRELVRYDEERNILVFPNEEAMIKLYDILDEKLYSDENNIGDAKEDIIDEDPVLEKFGKEIGFYEKSYRYLGLISEIGQLENGISPNDLIRPHVRNVILRAFLNENYTMQIGNELVVHAPGFTVKIKDGDIRKVDEIIEKIRNNEIMPNDREDENIEVMPTNGEDCAPNFDFSSFSSTNEVTFTYTGQPSAGNNVVFEWDFGDGNSSKDVNPTHIYKSKAGYKVCLKVVKTDEKGSIVCAKFVCKTLKESTGCSAEFNYSGFNTSNTGKFTYSGTPPDGATFLWTFGEGNMTSTDQNPSVTYTTKGVKEVCLTVTAPKCPTSVKSCKAVTVGELTVSTDCVSVFTWNQETGKECYVCFNSNISTTISASQIESYKWEFGDGGSSTEANPCYQYSCDGKKNVSLTVTTKDGKKCTSDVNSLISTFGGGLDLKTCTCCDYDIYDEIKEIKLNNEQNQVTCQIDSDCYWVKKNVNAEMWYYAKKKNGKWKKADMKTAKIQLFGEVFQKDAKGCACSVSVSVKNEESDSNKSYLRVRTKVEEKFGSRKGSPWGANFTINGVNVLTRTSDETHNVCE